MDIETFKVWLQAINMLGTFALGVWLYLEKRSDKTNLRVDALEAKVSGHSTDIAKMEASCQSCDAQGLSAQVSDIEKDVSALKMASEKAPNHDDLGEIYKTISDLAEKVNTLLGESEAQSQTLRQILNRIIEKGMP